jgi:hypothetical protein
MKAREQEDKERAGEGKKMPSAPETHPFQYVESLGLAYLLYKFLCYIIFYIHGLSSTKKRESLSTAPHCIFVPSNLLM